VVYQFYEIIFDVDVDDDDSYEILFRRIYSGLMAFVSLCSLILYIYHSDVIKLAPSKLQKIDFIFESIAVNKYGPRSAYRLAHIIYIYVILVILYFCTRYLRGVHFHTYVNFIAILRDCFVCTYFVIVNAFITLNFTKSIIKGINRFFRLNCHSNNRVSL